jgi:DNA invertase Pin-like site-specific DNA recombinase
MVGVTTADLYLRKSSADAGKSVGQQDDETTDAVSRRDWTIGRRFTDDARSASRYARRGRPDFAALLAHIRSGACELLAVWEASRPSRRESTYFELLEAARDAGTLIYVVTHDRTYDVRKRSDWKALAREALDAADYSAAISEASTRGKRARARAGIPDGRALDGYRTVRDDLGKAVGREFDPAREPVIRRMLTEALEYRTNVAIARGLNADGLTTARGGRWRPEDVPRVVTNPGYAAIRVYQPTKRPGQEREPVEHFEGKWSAFVTVAEHRRLVAFYQDPGRLKHHGTEPVWLLTGIAKCGVGDCGGDVRAKRVNRAPRYVCRTRDHLAVGAIETDEWVAAIVRERLDPDKYPDAREWFAPKLDSEALARAEGEQAALERELAEWRGLAKARKVTPASFAVFEADLLPQIEAAAARVRELSVPSDLARFADVDIPATWDALSIDDRRRIVRATMRVTLLPAAKRGQRWKPERVKVERP